MLWATRLRNHPDRQGGVDMSQKGSQRSDCGPHLVFGWTTICACAPTIDNLESNRTTTFVGHLVGTFWLTGRHILGGQSTHFGVASRHILGWRVDTFWWKVDTFWSTHFRFTCKKPYFWKFRSTHFGRQILVDRFWSTHFGRRGGHILSDGRHIIC